MSLNIYTLLASMAQYLASDLHLKAGFPPYYRIGGELKKIDLPALSGDEIDKLLTPIIPAARRAQLDERGDLDFSAQTPDGQRYRFNVFRAGSQLNAAVRRVRSEIPSFEELHLPPIYAQTIAKTYEGLILVCGITGSGKSTTLARMIEEINQHRPDHIVTIEDPVEFVFRPRKAIISQREIGIDIADYNHGLKYIVRQDPDVIFIGEMRDHYTMSAALQAAETGHLVFGSLHTADAAQAFGRILEFFTREEHSFIRGALANSLRGIFAQRLLPGTDPVKLPLVPATEVLLNNSTMREMVRREQDAELPNLIAASEKEGMHSFTTSLARLVQEGMVFRDTAMAAAPNPDALASMLRGIRTSTGGVLGR
ncbi:MAG: PilT/PilU family type 4a pilus ATPase [Phycisphaerae bacterium]|nr:PilT/PilU family type 4a pilus ATPase [Phycisphaerae bacterium]